MPIPPDVTDTLECLTQGDGRVIDELFPVVYEELRRLARRLMRMEPGHVTLDATALVHEAYASLVDQSRARYESRAHFFSIAAQALRRILVDAARRRASQKRGGDRERLTLRCVDQSEPTGEHPLDLLALEQSLQAFQQDHPDHARVVEMRYFGGMTHDAIALALGVTTRTVDRHWKFARAWLFRSLQQGEEKP